MEVRQVDLVKIDQTNPSDARRRQIDRRRTAEPPRADDQHRAVRELALPGVSELGKGDLA